MPQETQTGAPEQTSMTITNVRLGHSDTEKAATMLWKVECQGGKVKDVTSLPAQEEIIDSSSIIDAKGGLMLPSLCHAHIHLDKCFILDRCEILSGDFQEAMKVTGEAKKAFVFDSDDLYARGARVIRESAECGVTSMRAHVEVDTIVGFACLDVAQALQNDFKTICDIQIAVFAQEPLFTDAGDIPGKNYALIVQALERDEVAVIGSAPYVERTVAQSKLNIGLIVEAARRATKHIDFHLDYNLDPKAEPLIYEVIKLASENPALWGRRSGSPSQRCITIGHATRLQLFSPKEWSDLAEATKDFSITFVGLPQSDMYMQGRGDYNESLGAPRSTLRVPYILDKCGISIAMSVNNVGNAFTPQGSLDPLSLCTLGVTIFQSATEAEVRSLLNSVTLTAKRAIGQDGVHVGLFPSKGDPADFVILHGNGSVKAAVFSPSHDRTTIRAGVVVARRRTQTWFLETPQVDV